MKQRSDTLSDALDGETTIISDRAPFEKATPKKKRARRKKPKAKPSPPELRVVRLMPDSVTCLSGETKVKVDVRDPSAYRVGDLVDAFQTDSGRYYEKSAPKRRKIIDASVQN